MLFLFLKTKRDFYLAITLSTWLILMDFGGLKTVINI